MENIKKVWILGGSASGTGNMTPYAEYNVYVDPEAADIVLNAGMDTLWVTWDSAVGDTEITPEEVAALLDSRDPAALFCARCSRTLREYYRETYGRESFAVIDSMVMTAALFPEIMEETFRANCTIELAQGERRGCFRMEPAGQPNATICPAVQVGAFKRKLFALLGVGSQR